MTATKYFNMRITEADQYRIRRAAAKDGRTMASFMLRLALARADELLGQDRVEIQKPVPVEQPQLVDTSKSKAFDQLLTASGLERKTPQAHEPEPEPEKLDYTLPWMEFLHQMQDRGLDDDEIHSEAQRWEDWNS